MTIVIIVCHFNKLVLSINETSNDDRLVLLKKISKIEKQM